MPITFFGPESSRSISTFDRNAAPVALADPKNHVA